MHLLSDRWSHNVFFLLRLRELDRVCDLEQSCVCRDNAEGQIDVCLKRRRSRRTVEPSPSNASEVGSGTSE